MHEFLQGLNPNAAGAEAVTGMDLSGQAAKRPAAGASDEPAGAQPPAKKAAAQQPPVFAFGQEQGPPTVPGMIAGAGVLGGVQQGETGKVLDAAAYRNKQAVGEAGKGVGDTAAVAAQQHNSGLRLVPALGQVQQVQQQGQQQQQAAAGAAQQQGPPVKQGLTRMTLPFGVKEWDWQAQQGPAGWLRKPKWVPDEVNVIVYPDRATCFAVTARGSRRRVWCVDPECRGRSGDRSWTFLERADKYNRTGYGKGKGQGKKGVCILCALDYPDEIWSQAPIERILNDQWNEYRVGNGPPPDYPIFYGEPGSEDGARHLSGR